MKVILKSRIPKFPIVDLIDQPMDKQCINSVEMLADYAAMDKITIECLVSFYRQRVQLQSNSNSAEIKGKN
jgi:hypothetical protein